MRRQALGFQELLNSTFYMRWCREITDHVDNSAQSPSLAHLLFDSRSPLGRGWPLLLDSSLALAQLSQALPHADGHLRAQTPNKYAARVEPQHWIRGREGLWGWQHHLSLLPMNWQGNPSHPLLPGQAPPRKIPLQTYFPETP